MRPSPRLGLALVLFALGGSAFSKQSPNSRWITVFGAPQELALRNRRVSVRGRDGEFVVGGADDAALSVLADEGVLPWCKVARRRAVDLLLLPLRGRSGRPSVPAAATATSCPPPPTCGSSPASPARHCRACGSRRAPSSPSPARSFRLTPPFRGPAAATAPTVVNPLVQQIVDATDQASWFQYVRDLSGENPVTIGGQT